MKRILVVLALVALVPLAAWAQALAPCLVSVASATYQEKNGVPFAELAVEIRNADGGGLPDGGPLRRIAVPIPWASTGAQRMAEAQNQCRIYREWEAGRAEVNSMILPTAQGGLVGWSGTVSP